MRLLVIPIMSASILFLTVLFLMPNHATTYYVSAGGNDAGAGTSPAHPWRSVERVNRHRFMPGDRVLFHGGQAFAGKLLLTSDSVQAGKAGLVVSSYGAGCATIDGGAADGAVVEDVEGLVIEHLIFVAAGRKANDGQGVTLRRAPNARVVGVDVSGFRLGGVSVEGCTHTLLDHVYAHDNGSAGISVEGGYAGIPRSRDVTIRDCRVIDNPGDPKNLNNHSGNGIVVGGVDGCLIEYCEAAKNGWDMPRQGNGPVGIWAWNANRVTIRHCISHDNRSPGTDGGGFDLDGGVTDSVMEENLSFGNMGSGYQLCQYEGGGEWRNNVVRNNVSYDDGLKNFQSGISLFIPEKTTNMSDALVERNTIVNSHYAIATMGDVPGVVYRDNVFVSGEDTLKLTWGPGGFRKAKFSGNLAWSSADASPIAGKDSPFKSTADWIATGGLVADPLLSIPKSTDLLPTDPRKLVDLAWFAPSAGSPCRSNGKIVRGAALGRLRN
jgi:hypothetical protein